MIGQQMKNLKTFTATLAALGSFFGLTAEAAYVTDGLILHYDAINNTGSGHDSSATSWKELSGQGNDFVLPAGAVWGDDCISFCKVAQARTVLGDTYANADLKDFTFEFVVRMHPDDKLAAEDNPTSEARVIDMRRCSLWMRRPGTQVKDSYGAVGSHMYVGASATYSQEFETFNGELHTVDYLKRFHTYAIKEHMDAYSSANFWSAIDGSPYYVKGSRISEAGSKPMNKDLTLGHARRSVQIRAIRVYSRHLTEAEVAQNAAEDAARWPTTADPEKAGDPFADARWFFRGARGTAGVNGGQENIANSLYAGGSFGNLTPADRAFYNYGENSNCVIRTMDVVSPFSGRTLKDRKVIDFRQCVRTSGGQKLCKPSVKRFSVPGCYTNMHETTILARFRIDDYAADEHSATLAFLDIGYGYSNESGTCLRFLENGGAGSDDFWVRAYHGTNVDDFKDMLGGGRFRISKGKWIDFALTVKGRNNRLYYQVEGGDFFSQLRDAAIANNKDSRHQYLNLAADMGSNGSISISEVAASSVTQFRGQIQQLAVWDRELSLDEVKQCFREDCGDEDDALKLGVPNGNRAEFAGTATTVNAGDSDAWLGMTNALDRAGDALTVNFDLPSARTLQARTFRFSAAPGAPEGALLEVKLNGCLLDDALAVVAEKTVSVAIPPAIFKSTGNVLTVRRADAVAGAVGIDAIVITAGGTDQGDAPTGVANGYDVYSDVFCWYKGFVDENGDGLFFPDAYHSAETACDCRDALRVADRKSEFHKWGMAGTVKGGKFRHENLTVALPAADRTLADEPCLRVVAEAVGSADRPQSVWGGIHRKIFAVTNATGYSALARIRLENYMHAASNKVAQVFGTGYDWTNSRGMALALKGEPDNMFLTAYAGRTALEFKATQTGDAKNRLMQGKWIDVGYTVSNGWVRVYTCVEGGDVVEQLKNGGGGALGATGASSYLYIGSTNGSGANGSYAASDFCGFNGYFHHVAVWPRQLSSEEMALAMKWPEPDVFHVGTVNGSAQEFLGPDQPFVVPENGEFRSATACLAPGESYELRFSCDAAKLRNQRLVLATTAGSCDAQFKVELNGEQIVNYAQADRSEIKFLTVPAGGWSEFGIRREKIIVGENVLRLTRVDDHADVAILDAVSLGNQGENVKVLSNAGLAILVK